MCVDSAALLGCSLAELPVADVGLAMENHIIFSDARSRHSHNTVETIALVEALSFARAPWPGCP